MTVKAITHCYTQDGHLENKVIGIFDRKNLKTALQDIREFYKDRGVSIVRDNYDESCDNYLMSFDDVNSSYFYTSDFTLNELNF